MSSATYDIVIIGTGIAGLYTAHRILQKDPKCKLLILERNDHPGGRIQTFKHGSVSIEGGAGRFNQNHVLLLRLLKELNLEDLKVEIPGDIHFFPSTQTYDVQYINQSPFTVMNHVLQYAKKMSRTELRKFPFMEIVKRVFRNRPKDVQFLKDSFGYYQQLMEMNAFDAVKLFDEGMHSKNTFYTLKGGLSQIIQQLLYKIAVFPNVHVQYSHEVSDIKWLDDIQLFCVQVRRQAKQYLVKKCVAAIPKPGLQKLSIFRPIENSYLRAIQIKPLCRIYTQFAKKDIWFRTIPKTTTNNTNRYIIPIDREQGWIMLSYTDSRYAHYWRNLATQTKIVNKLRENVQKTFGFKIAEPIKMKVCFWDVGTAFWKPQYNSHILSKRIIQPNMSYPLYICGENFSMNQGWMEGALETSEEVIKRIM